MDQIVAYVAMKDVQDSLIKMPIADAKSDIDLGELTMNSNEAQSSNTISDNAADFNLSLSQLKEMARTDNVLKTIKNLYANYDMSTGVYCTMNIVYQWFSLDPSQISNKFADPAADNYITMGNLCYILNFNINDPANVIYNNIAATNDTLDLFPPATVYGISYYGYNPADTNAWIRSTNNPGQFASSKVSLNDNNYAYFYLNADQSPITCNYSYFGWLPVPGFWYLKKNQSQVLATYDMAAGSPPDSNGHPYVYIPAVRLNVNPDKSISSIDIKWYYYGAGGYQEVTDFTDFNNAVANISVGLDRYVMGYRYGEYGKFTNNSYTPQSAWDFFGSSVTNRILDAVSINYNMYGSGFRVEWR
jgi:hypothetical protein